MTGMERRTGAARDAAAVAKDHDEDPTGPTTVPPAVEPQDRRQDSVGAPDAQDVSKRTSTGELIESSPQPDESYFDNPPATEVPSEPPKNHGARLSPPKRAITAPAENGIRPIGLRRSSTLLNVIMRTATGGSIDDVRDTPHPYASDLVESSSETSTDEEAEAARKKSGSKKINTRAGKPQTGTNPKSRAGKGHTYRRFAMGNEHYNTHGRVSRRDGRLNISVNETANSGYVAKALSQGIKHHLNAPKRRKGANGFDGDADVGDDAKADADSTSIASSMQTQAPRPRLNIVIMVIGSRGDIQPFLKIGKILKEDYGHRVRIASHPTFRDFAEKDCGLEFFSVGGDPAELMDYVTKNPGLIPNLQTIREGEIGRRRNAMAEMFDGFWRACINTTDDEKDRQNLKMMGGKQPFIADFIIANPPSMAHCHIAERLGIGLHIFFTFPYTPTQQFPHPMANIKPQRSNVDLHYVNWMSYPLVEMMTWQGLGDIVNRFRENTLGLEPVSSLWAPGALYRMRVPYTYLWSPSLVPKPKDWGPEIDIAGYVFLDLASDFTPDDELRAFLDAGEPPVYIGFGSIIIPDPDAFTQMIFDAAKMAGVRAVVNKGWGGLGGQSNGSVPDHVFMLGNTPHDWLFPRVSAVVHHGGAGTTAIGLKCGKPTMIVPFFGDQPFWGAMVAEAKAGAHDCIPFKKLTTELLAKGIRQCLTDEARRNVQKIAASIAHEGDGAQNAVKSFHRSLPLVGRQSIRCSILEDRVAVWQLRRSSLRLSALAATILHDKGKIKWSDLKLIRHVEWNDFDGPGEPITGTIAAVKDSLYDMGEGVGMVPVRIAKHIRKHEERQRRLEARRKRKEERQKLQSVQAHSTKAGDANAAPKPTNGDGRPHAQREQTQTTLGSAISSSPSEPLPKKVVGEIGAGFRKTGAALVTMPDDLLVAFARGLHNAPRLWGDSTVRKPVRITGVKSGFLAARREFQYGVWDGWTGLVTQPVGDWRDAATTPGKFAGLGKGVGKGVGGFVLKNASALVAPPAYVCKGVIKYVAKRADKPGTKAFIRRAHILRGQKDLHALRTQPSDAGGDERLRRVAERVREGWRVYEELWETTHARPTGPRGNLVHRVRLDREKRRWDVNGALENVTTVHRALRAHRAGEDLEEVFAQRRREMAAAERPRPGAVAHPRVEEDDADRARGSSRGGFEEATTYPDRRPEEAQLGPEPGPRPRNASHVSEGLSERTAVATPTEEKFPEDKMTRDVESMDWEGHGLRGPEMADGGLSRV